MLKQLLPPLFSAYAEVFPGEAKVSSESTCFSLPTQRCFRCLAHEHHDIRLFSAYAEVFPRRRVTLCIYFPFLCLRRGVSLSPGCGYVQKVFSLPTQRCFCVIHSGSASPPTFLCLRRGVSVPRLYLHHPASFSLPTQRCFRHHAIRSLIGELFSAYAEVFLSCACCFTDAASFSLPTQRCFQSKYAAVDYGSLFSAYAEVFPSTLKTPRKASPFLCLRRGVSPPLHRPGCPGTFSLPTQRCFLRPHGSQSERPLFSAYAEVFPGEEPFIRIDDHFSLPTQRCFPVF